jgi:hypothetical protein
MSRHEHRAPRIVKSGAYQPRPASGSRHGGEFRLISPVIWCTEGRSARPGVVTGRNRTSICSGYDGG